MTDPRAHYDQTLKRLLLRAHDGFLALVAPDLTWRGELSPELPAIARMADLAWSVARPDGTPGTLHVELQARSDAAIGERMAEYLLRVYRRDHQEVHSLVVLLRPSAQVPPPPFVIEWMGQPSLVCMYEIMELWRIPQERVLDLPHAELWPLAALMAGVSAESVARVADRIAAAPLPREQRSELESLLMALAGAQVPRASLAAMLRRNGMLEDLLNDSTMVQLWREEGEARGREEGEARGREEGEAKGREEGEARGREEGGARGHLEGLRRSARVVLEARFGAADAAILTALDALHDTGALEALVAACATDSPDALRARVGLAPGA